MGLRPLNQCRVTNPFAARGSYASRSDSHGAAGHHTGVDFAGPIPGVSIAGKALRSSTPGKVTISEYQRNSNGSSTMGNWVGVYYAADDVLITYWHMQSRDVKIGDMVQRGQVIGRLGDTGNASGAHVHVQANRGTTFDYHGHISPDPWVRGPVWAGYDYLRRKRAARRAARNR